MKNILFLNSLSSEQRNGGAEIAVETSAQLFCNQGYNVFFVSLSINEEKEFIKNGVQRVIWKNRSERGLENLGTFSFFTRILWHIEDLLSASFSQRLENFIKENAIDTVFTHNIKGFGLQGIFSTLSSLSIEWVHTLHDVQFANPSGCLYVGRETKWENNSFFQFPFLSIFKKIWREPNLLIFPSHFLQKYYHSKKLFLNSIQEVLRNPVVLPKNLNEQEIITTKENNTHLQLLYVGQLVAHKGIQTLFPILEKINTVDLTLIGAGNSLDLYKKIAPKSCHFLGFVEREKLSQYYKQCDFVILPTLVYENSPNIIIEAFSLGIPVIVRNIGGAGELIQKGKNGYIYSTDDELKILLENLYKEKQEKTTLQYKQCCIKTIESFNFLNYLTVIKKYLS